MEIDRSEEDLRDLGRFWALTGLAFAATLTAAVAGLVLGIANPDDGSGARDFFRSVAAGGGLAAGALFGLAAVWAQVKDLWRFAPQWFRYLTWGVLVVVAVAAILSSSSR